MLGPKNTQDDNVMRALDEAAHGRADMYQAILALEQAAARPAATREEQWTTGVIEALAQLEREIIEHVETTEGPDGLFDEIIGAAPRLSHNVQLLREEHSQMLEAASTLNVRLTTEPVRDARSVDATRDEIQRLLGRLVKHRQRGADLVWEAYNRDIGGDQ
jgi:DNA-binding GntR family transcriptional regulator